MVVSFGYVKDTNRFDPGANAGSDYRIDGQNKEGANHAKIVLPVMDCWIDWNDYWYLVRSTTVLVEN